jgi:hypothetical protein
VDPHYPEIVLRDDATVLDGVTGLLSALVVHLFDFEEKPAAILGHRRGLLLGNSVIRLSKHFVG